MSAADEPLDIVLDAGRVPAQHRGASSTALAMASNCAFRGATMTTKASPMSCRPEASVKGSADGGCGDS